MIKQTLALAAASIALGACSISIEDSGGSYATSYDSYSAEKVYNSERLVTIEERVDSREEGGLAVERILAGARDKDCRTVSVDSYDGLYRSGGKLVRGARVILACDKAEAVY